MIDGTRRNAAIGSVRAAAALASLLCLAGCADSRSTATPPSLIGAWESKMQFTDGPFAAVKDLRCLYVFNAGGTLSESSNYDEAPPVPPSYGEWRSTSANHFEAKYTFFNSMPARSADSLVANGGWLPGGHGVLVEQIKLDPQARSFESTIAFQLFDAAGHQTGSFTGRASALRAGF